MSSQVVNLMKQGKLGPFELAAAADVVAADCRYNYWLTSEVKKAGLNISMASVYRVLEDAT
jgi:hypothetical protein